MSALIHDALREANRTLDRLIELAPKVAPDVSGHDGYYFTHGYDTAEERAAAAEALSLVEHALAPAVAELRALRAAVTSFLRENPRPTGAKADRDDYATLVSCGSLFRLHAALSPQTPPHTEGE